MLQPFALYLIARQHRAEIEWPVLEAEDAQKAVLCFTDAMRAQQYIDGHNAQALGWSVVQMEFEEFLRWLRNNLLKGVHLLLIDPKSNENHGRSLPIFPLLVEEGSDLSALAEVSLRMPGNSQSSSAGDDDGRS